MNMKKVFSFTLSFLLVALFSASPVLADLSFEQGLTDWTVEPRQDSWPTTSHGYIYDVISTRYSDGVKSIRLGANVVGDYSVWSNSDKTQTIVWKNGTYDLTHGLSISVDMTDVQHAMQQYYWGWGMEADLILSDGVNETRSLLWDYHEENTGNYGKPGLEDDYSTSTFIGHDNTEWKRYRVPLSSGSWYGTDFGGGPLSGLDLSHVKIGVVYAAINWHSSPQTLWANGLVDNVMIEYKDTGSDGVIDPIDNCPSVSNPDQTDTDGDGQGNACDTDDDGDGVLDTIDCAPQDPSAWRNVTVYADVDQDGVTTGTGEPMCLGASAPAGWTETLNGNDNCPSAPNSDQLDTDSDGYGDACDSDKDGDEIPDELDCDPMNKDVAMKVDTKACILYTSGVSGEGILNAPGLQKPFNPNSNAPENAGKKK